MFLLLLKAGLHRIGRVGGRLDRLGRHFLPWTYGQAKTGGTDALIGPRRAKNESTAFRLPAPAQRIHDLPLPAADNLPIFPGGRPIGIGQLRGAANLWKPPTARSTEPVQAKSLSSWGNARNWDFRVGLEQTDPAAAQRGGLNVNLTWSLFLRFGIGMEAYVEANQRLYRITMGYDPEVHSGSIKSTADAHAAARLVVARADLERDGCPPKLISFADLKDLGDQAELGGNIELVANWGLIAGYASGYGRNGSDAFVSVSRYFMLSPAYFNVVPSAAERATFSGRANDPYLDLCPDIPVSPLVIDYFEQSRDLNLAADPLQRLGGRLSYFGPGTDTLAVALNSESLRGRLVHNLQGRDSIVGPYAVPADHQKVIHPPIVALAAHADFSVIAEIWMDRQPHFVEWKRAGATRSISVRGPYACQLAHLLPPVAGKTSADFAAHNEQTRVAFRFEMRRGDWMSSEPAITRLQANVTRAPSNRELFDAAYQEGEYEVARGRKAPTIQPADLLAAGPALTVTSFTVDPPAPEL